ncbi:MAG: multiheme c-type cytochrome [Deltaproteobacteria bacterium]|nr:multiheme c-type cytochrome [Deltaproteobacteria bacterium]
MRGIELVRFLSTGFAILTILACGEQPIDVQALKSKPKEYVGSDTCKMCHLEHFDSWKMTLHSRMLQDAQKNRDAIVTEINEKEIRADLAKLGDKLKVPADKIYVPKIEEIKYTIGSQWKQRYLVEKDGKLYIAPVQYNLDTHRWVNYHEADWDKRPWIMGCGGCHATGADLEKNTFVEPGVACEACHGKGSWHAALPKTEVFEKRATIVNPAKLTMGVAVQICGSCHNRGKSTKVKGAGWPVGYEPGKALEAFYKSTSFEAGDVKHVYANEFSKGHHQQYIDWSMSKHAKEGVTCTSCHFVHQVGMPPTRSQTVGAGSKQCLICHDMINNNLAHSIHSFGNCVGCHMPRIAESAESGDIHSHVFVALLPKDTLANPVIPNSCQTCHKHKDQDLKQLQAEYDALAVLPKPVGPSIQPIHLHEPKKESPKPAEKKESPQKPAQR